MNEHRYKVALIVPVYNGFRGQENPEWFRLCLESAALSKRNGMKILVYVVNDGSTDGTEEWLLEKWFDRVDIMNLSKNYGTAHAFNRGIDTVDADYIALLGSDDITLPDRLVKQATYLDEHPDIPMVGSYYNIIDADGNVKYEETELATDPDDIRFWLYSRHCDIGVPMFRKSLWEELGGFDSVNCPTHASDYDFYLRTAELYDIGIVPEILYSVRVDCPRLTDDVKTHTESAYQALERSRERRRQKRKEQVPCNQN